MYGAMDTRPIHRVYVEGFWMDQTDVTNAQFEKFVRATGYVTIAERKPRAKGFLGAPPEKLVAGSVVFSPHRSGLKDQLRSYRDVQFDVSHTIARCFNNLAVAHYRQA